MTEYKFDLSVAKLQLEPGDILIFKTIHRLTKEQATAIRDRINSELPPDIKALIVSGIEVTKLAAKDVPLDWKKLL